MQRYFFWILLSISCFNSLVAEEESETHNEPFDSSLVKTQNLLSTVVNSVSAISGSWILSETDFIVLGPEPLILNRYYMGDHTHSDKLGYNWEFSRPHQLIIDLKEKKTHHAKALARLHQPSGIASIHESDTTSQEKLEKTIIPLILSQTQGLTNCREEMSAKTNLHNMVLHLDCKNKRCAAISGSGHFTYYEFSHQQNLSEWKQETIGTGHYRGHFLDYYQPVYERKPNGNTVHFKKGNISTANSSNTQIYSSLQFDNQEIDTLNIEASDGKTATYKFSTYHHFNQIVDGKSFKKDRFYLSEASFSHKPSETYEYTDEPPSHFTQSPQDPLLKAKRQPNGRCQEVEYYHCGTNHLNMNCNGKKDIRKIFINEEEDFRVNRVKVIKSPVGYHEKPIITHRFIYEADPSDKLVKKTTKSFSGKTKVYDAYLRKTVYEYNKEHRPTRIKYCGSEKNLHFEDCYTWDNENELLQNTIKQITKVMLAPSTNQQLLTSISNSIVQNNSTNRKKEQIHDFIKTCLKSKILETGGQG